MNRHRPLHRFDVSDTVERIVANVRALAATIFSRSATSWATTELSAALNACGDSSRGVALWRRSNPSGTVDVPSCPSWSIGLSRCGQRLTMRSDDQVLLAARLDQFPA